MEEEEGEEEQEGEEKWDSLLRDYREEEEEIMSSHLFSLLFPEGGKESVTLNVVVCRIRFAMLSNN